MPKSKAKKYKAPPDVPLPDGIILYDVLGWKRYIKAVEAVDRSATGFGMSCPCNGHPVVFETDNPDGVCQACGKHYLVVDIRAALGVDWIASATVIPMPPSVG